MTEEPKTITFGPIDPEQSWTIDARLFQSATLAIPTSVTALSELRFCGGVLQQAWQITEYSGGAPSRIWKQWRPVPSVPAETGQGRPEEDNDAPDPA